MKKKIILSFDYELFFGDKSGTVQKTLIDPTKKLLDVMDSVGFKGNFFIDWLMLKYLKAEDDIRCQHDYELIVNQIKDIVARGHRIELHIHSHWVDAKYNGDWTWDFGDFKHYSLQSFNEKDITQMLVDGTNLLTSIAQEVDPDYRIVAFRAGGWAIQPFSKLSEGFKSAGIKIDSSVMPGVEIVTDYSYCNFLNLEPPTGGAYRFSDDVNVEDNNGAFIEVPISSIRPNIPSRIVAKIARIMGVSFDSLADGTHERKCCTPDKWNFPSKRSVCTFSSVAPLDNLLRLLFAPGSVFCFIDHPKDLSRQTIPGIKMLSYFCESMLYKDFLK